MKKLATWAGEKLGKDATVWIKVRRNPIKPREWMAAAKTDKSKKWGSRYYGYGKDRLTAIKQAYANLVEFAGEGK